jgi:hypothetical protein
LGTLRGTTLNNWWVILYLFFNPNVQKAFQYSNQSSNRYPKRVMDDSLWTQAGQRLPFSSLA